MQKVYLFLISSLLLSACRTTKPAVAVEELNEDVRRAVEAALAETRKIHAPDKRTALFTVEPAGRGNELELRGETNLPEAKQAFLAKLTAQGIAYQDRIGVLPLPEVGEKTLGVVTISVASIRSEPREAAELATQATLGTPVRRFKQQGTWCLAQTPDGYIAWADAGAIAWMDPAQYARWKESPKLVYVNPTGYAYAEPAAAAPVVSDLVGGSVLRRLGEQGEFYRVAYPDGREAFVSSAEAKPYETWLAGLQTTEQSLVGTAKRMMGLPYLWGGTSYKAVDCSGFTKTVYFMNGLIIPRDASQQVHAGELVDISNGFGALRPGDLLFFGKPAVDAEPERVTHVGLWIGNHEFIHAASQVRVSSLDPVAPHYDEFNHQRLLRVKRILGKPSSLVMPLNRANVF
ncbi:MAG: C40 family peptidase [Ferruginibacter sp.]|nr:C40 family peptidase [Cytophagales bacterium]